MVLLERYLEIVLLTLTPSLASQIAVKDLQDGEIVPSSYIVTLKPTLVGAEVENHLEWLNKAHKRALRRRDFSGLRSTYNIGQFQAYAGEFDDATVSQIQQKEEVLFVEHDRAARLTSLVTETNAPWGLAAISHRSQLTNDSILGQKYIYDSSSGQGTFAYVIDVGILINNTEFEGRAVRGHNSVAEYESFDETAIGHGSHVAGIIGSRTYGVAKKANIVDVKVAVGFGLTTTSYLLDGFNWAVNNATNSPGRAAKSVINMSIGVEKSAAVNAAVDAAYAQGVLTVAAAGNSGKDADELSPASAPKAFTVGATYLNNSRPYWSNYGPAIDIFAPGANITSTWNKEGAPQIDSGTSMASPHVAGLVLYLKALEGLDSPDDITKRVRELATKDVVKDPGAGSPNLFANNGNGVQ